MPFPVPFSSAHDTYVPKHRQAPVRRASRAAVRTMFVLSSAAVLGTGAAVAGGSLSLAPDRLVDDLTASSAEVQDDVAQAAGGSAEELVVAAEPQTGAASPEPAADDAAEEGERRAVPLSRSDRRGVADPRKEAVLSLEPDQNAMTRSEDASDEDPRTVAAMLVGDATQFDCLDSLWTKESGWQVDADNPTSSAYGIPQALPGSKMSSAGADWATNPVTQIRWGLGYIEDRYGSPCGAWAHSVSNNWY